MSWTWHDRTDEIAALLHVEAVSLVQLPGGASREAYRVETPDGVGVAFLRADGPGITVMAGTDLTLGREAELLRKVRSLGFPVPAVLGTFADPDATLLELIPGTSRPEDTSPDGVAAEYMALLARLHQVEPADVGLPTFDSVATALRSDLAWWGNSASDSARARPLVRLALRALTATLPADDTAPTLVHGDAGPGNLMVDGGRVTAMLDWELSHAGDVHEDLAWIWMRGAHTDFGSFDERVREYEQAAGRALDRDRLHWHVALVMTKSVISMWGGILSAAPGDDVMRLLVGALAYDALLASALARVLGGSLPLLEEAPAPTTSVDVALVDQISARVGEGDRVVHASLRQLRGRLSLAEWQQRRLAEDSVQHLGVAPGDIYALVDSADEDQLLPLVLVLGGAADRQAHVEPRSVRWIRRAQTNGLGTG